MPERDSVRQLKVWAAWDIVAPPLAVRRALGALDIRISAHA